MQLTVVVLFHFFAKKNLIPQSLWSEKNSKLTKRLALQARPTQWR
jgi:hypothetical protein